MLKRCPTCSELWSEMSTTTYTGTLCHKCREVIYSETPALVGYVDGSPRRIVRRYKLCTNCRYRET